MFGFQSTPSAVAGRNGSRHMNRTLLEGVSIHAQRGGWAKRQRVHVAQIVADVSIHAQRGGWAKQPASDSLP